MSKVWKSKCSQVALILNIRKLQNHKFKKKDDHKGAKS